MPPEVNNEVDDFFAGLPVTDKREADIFAINDDEEAAAAKKTSEEEASKNGETVITPAKDDDDEPRKNRRHRRLEQQLQDEREKRIRAEALAEGRAAAALREDPNTDPLLVQMYGDNADAIRLHQQLLTQAEQRAEERAFKRMQDARASEEQEKSKFQSEIISHLEGIEDAFDVDLTSDAPRARKTRDEFLGLVKQLSPKNERGEILAYVDMDSAWKIFQGNRTKEPAEVKKEETTTRAKEISAQTMTKSTVGANAPKAVTPGFDGWKKDFGIL